MNIITRSSLRDYGLLYIQQRQLFRILSIPVQITFCMLTASPIITNTESFILLCTIALYEVQKWTIYTGIVNTCGSQTPFLYENHFEMVLLLKAIVNVVVPNFSSEPDFPRIGSSRKSKLTAHIFYWTL